MECNPAWDNVGELPRDSRFFQPLCFPALLVQGCKQFYDFFPPLLTLSAVEATEGAPGVKNWRSGAAVFPCADGLCGQVTSDESEAPQGIPC